MPRHSKKNPCVGVELRAGGTLIGLRSQGGVPVTQGSGLKKKMPRYPVSPTGILQLVFLTCSNSARSFLTCSKSAN